MKSKVKALELFRILGVVELTKKILECLKNKFRTIDEISDYLFANSTTDNHFIAKFRQNIYYAISKLKQRNIIKQDFYNL